ncbi:MAG: hypothetical protein CMI51_10005 [Paracoccus sp.]|jgi:hypothetical protein|nr:hypothetical protein [Paracoccus sp. (in: a-proteobacteria)]|tara:strand:+ start:4948 stop:5217 length:270 start_codon:yes stop_codon:yes gene_type:complete
MLRKARFGPRLGPPMIGGFPVPTATDAMLPALLLLILTGSFVTATAMAVQGASWAMIGMGYVLGGWAGLFLGLPLAMLAAGRLQTADPD